MAKDNRKVALIGTGMVGMSYAYALLNQSVCDELLLIDVDRQRAEGEAMDLNHGLAFSGSHMRISAGDYGDAKDADIAVIAAGVAQKPGESRLELLRRNAAVFRSVIAPLIEHGFNGILLVATNPVDLMTRVAHDLSGFPAERVFGSGTALDTARLRYLLGDYFGLDPRNVHAYVIGEHGDSEFVPWSQATAGTKPVLELCAENADFCTKGKLDLIAREVRDAAEKIIRAKRATYYGIGMALCRITKAIFGDENSILTLSARLDGSYGQQDLYAGVPCIVNRQGIKRILHLTLSDSEKKQFSDSCNVLFTAYEELKNSK